MAIIQNGSPLFAGDAGSGPSNIRQYILENDWLDAIIQLSTDQFMNTGISTYIWVLCKNEMIKKEITIRFSNVICIYMQSCRFWAGGNSIQCMYVADDTYIMELQSKQNQNQELYSESRLAHGDRFIPVGMEINSGDELVICCKELEMI